MKSRCRQSRSRRAVWLLIGTLPGIFVGLSAEPQHDPRGPGTIRMAERLEELARHANPVNNIFLNAERAEMLKSELAKATNFAQRENLRFSFASELLDSGKNMDALQEFEGIEQELKTSNPQAFQKNWIKLNHEEALCWIRIGEVTNCLADHNPESCLAPIQGRGIHRFQEGSRNAIRILTGILERTPDDLPDRWLLNIASMTVGDYPDKVPVKWRVPPNAFASEYDMKRFPEVAGSLGLDPMKRSGGSILEDFDGDGNLDVMCSSIGVRDQLRFYHNNGDGTFTNKLFRRGYSAKSAD